MHRSSDRGGARRHVRGHRGGLPRPQGIQGPPGRRLILRLRGRADSSRGRRRDGARSRHLRLRGGLGQNDRAQRGRRRVRDNETRVPALPRGPRRRGRDTPRRGLRRRDGRAPGEAPPPHRRLAVGGDQGVT